MAGRVDEVEDVVLAVAGRVGEPDGLRLDRDAALALDVHRVQHLRGHLARLERAAALDQPVGQRRLAVVDMRDDGEVADAGEVGHGVLWERRLRQAESPLWSRQAFDRSRRV